MELVGMPHPGPDNFNAAPTESIVVLRLDDADEPELVPMRWWLTPFWSKSPSTKYSMFNARSETAHKSPAFREPLKKRRCVVPVCGFYEWVRQENRKLPYYITPREVPGLLLAGIWDAWVNKETGELIESFAILTAPAAPAMEFVHNRQPVMLSLADAHVWLRAGADVTGELMDSRIPVDLEAIPVSAHVNNARHKDARCSDPIGAPVAIPETRP
jgi:putative SOS response-associated peptidase YedK